MQFRPRVLSHPILVKVDGSGEIVWTRRYEDLDGSARSVIATDAGYLIAGTVASNASTGDDVFLREVDASGEILWTTIHGTVLDEDPVVLLENTTGFALLGNSVDPSDIVGDSRAPGYDGYEGRSAPFALLVDRDGHELGFHRYTSAGNEIVSGAVVTDSGNLVVLSQIMHFPSPDNDICLVELGGDGSKLWEHLWIDANAAGFDMVATEDGGYIISGSISFPEDTSRSSDDALILKTDSQSDELWRMTYGESDQIDTAHAICERADGALIAVGWQEPDLFAPNDSILIALLDADGTLRATIALPSRTHNLHEALISLDDGAFVLAGASAAPRAPFRSISRCSETSLIARLSI